MFSAGFGLKYSAEANGRNVLWFLLKILSLSGFLSKYSVEAKDCKILWFEPKLVEGKDHSGL